jgi:hypothetical protein
MRAEFHGQLAGLIQRLQALGSWLRHESGKGRWPRP